MDRRFARRKTYKAFGVRWHRSIDTEGRFCWRTGDWRMFITRRTKEHGYWYEVRGLGFRDGTRRLQEAFRSASERLKEYERDRRYLVADLAQHSPAFRMSLAGY